MRKTALISGCGRYRYRLTREWGDPPYLPFVMLNPSTADAHNDDPTIRRCIGFAKREGFGGLIVINQYAYRATTPDELNHAAYIDVPGNRAQWHMVAHKAARTGTPIVCAWGSHFKAQCCERRITGILSRYGADLVCLGKTKAGHPRHPLRIRADQPLVAFA